MICEMPEAENSSNIHDADDPCIGSPQKSSMPHDPPVQPPTVHDHTSNQAVLPAESPESVSYHGDLQPGKGSFMMPTQDQLDGFLSYFFEVLYPMPSYAFLHPQSTKRRCYSRKKSCSLSLALCSVASVHMRDQSGGTFMSVPHARMQDLASAWIRAAEQSIWLQLENPSISRLQTLLLIIHYHMETAHFQRAFMLIATAARFAAALRLNHERHHCDHIAQEVGRRILWSLKIVERYFSVGLAEFDMLPLEVIYIEYPQREEVFLGTELNQQDFRGEEENGAYRLLIQLEVVRRDIMRLTRNITLLEEPLVNLAELVDHHRRTIAAIEIPPHLSHSRGSMGPEDFFEDRWLPRRILAHISWHQTHCDLYRILLPGYSEAASSAVLRDYDASELARAEDLCSHHAMRIIDIITTLNQHSSRWHLLEFDTAICAYHATRLVLYISRLGNRRNRLSPEFALSRAQLCLAALKRFFFASALVAPIIRELEQSIRVFSTQQHQKQRGRACSSVSISQRTGNGTPPEISAIATNRPLDLPNSPEKSISNQCTDGGQDRHLSSAAQIRQRLAIHSLLRRADFPDNDEEDEEARVGQHGTIARAPQSGGQPSPLPSHEPLDLITSPPMIIHQAYTQRPGQRDAEPDFYEYSPASSVMGVMETNPNTLSIGQSDPDDTVGSNVSVSNNLTEAREQAQPAASIVASPTTLDTTSPSTASDQGMVGTESRDGAWDAGDIELSIFSWWGSQDWGWLSDMSGRTMF